MTSTMSSDNGFVVVAGAAAPSKQRQHQCNDNNTAITLLQRSTDLQTLMEQCRTEIRSTRETCRRLQSQIDELRQSRRDERTLTLEAAKNVEQFRLRLDSCVDSTKSTSTSTSTSTNDDDRHHHRSSTSSSLSLREQLGQAEMELAAVVVSHQTATQSQLRWKHYYQEQMHMAMEASREFRQWCQQMQQQQQQLKTYVVTPQSPRTWIYTVAACEALGIAVDTTSADTTNFLRTLYSDQISALAAVSESYNNETDPTTWEHIIHTHDNGKNDEDYELMGIVDEYKERLRERNEAQIALQQVETQRAALVVLCENRTDCAHQLRQQLALVLADCNQLESKTAELDLLTLDDEALIDTYRTRIEQRRCRSKTSSLSSSNSGRVATTTTPTTFVSARPMSLLHTTSHRPALRRLPAKLIPPMVDDFSTLENVQPSATKEVVDNHHHQVLLTAAPSSESQQRHQRNPYTSSTTSKRSSCKALATESKTSTSYVGADPPPLDTDENNSKRTRRDNNADDYDELASIVLGPTSLTARRLRRDRHFGCSLGVDTCGTGIRGTNSNDSGVVGDKDEVNRSNSENGAVEPSGVSSIGQNGGTLSAATLNNNSNGDNDDNSEEEGEDDVLNYVAFAKKP